MSENLCKFITRTDITNGALGLLNKELVQTIGEFSVKQLLTITMPTMYSTSR